MLVHYKDKETRKLFRRKWRTLTNELFAQHKKLRCYEYFFLEHPDFVKKRWLSLSPALLVLKSLVVKANSNDFDKL